MTLTMPITEFRDRLSAILDQVESGQQTVVITRRGHAQAVLISSAEFETLIKQRQEPEPSFYVISQASLARIWEHPDEDVYTWEDGEPLKDLHLSFQ